MMMMMITGTIGIYDDDVDDEDNDHDGNDYNDASMIAMSTFVSRPTRGLTVVAKREVSVTKNKQCKI